MFESDGTSGLKLAYNFTEEYPPVPEIMVYLLKENTDVLAASDETDMNGVFKFKELIDGSYSMLVDYMGIPMSDENLPILIDESNRNLLIYVVVSSSEISFEIVSGPDNITLYNKDLVIYPNPAADHIILKFNNTIPAADYTLRINSIIGKTVRNKIIHVHDTSQEFIIPIDDLQAGIYLISLSGNEYIYKKRFIKL